MPMPEQYLDLHDIARLAGITPETARYYRKRSKAHRAQGQPHPGDLPEADAYPGSRDTQAIPGWKRATIEHWLANRPRRPRAAKAD